MNLKSVPLNVWSAICVATIGLIDVGVFHHIWSGCFLIAASLGLAVWALIRVRQSNR